jgi:hypothetical protein
LENSAFKGLVVLMAGTVDDHVKGDVKPMLELFDENKYGWVGDISGKARL